jgi:hypothetical protein
MRKQLAYPVSAIMAFEPYLNNIIRTIQNRDYQATWRAKKAERKAERGVSDSPIGQEGKRI